MTHELDTLAARRDELDDAELANLEEQSQVVDDLAAAHRAEIELAAGAERATADLAAAEAAIDEQLADLTVQRADAVTRRRGRSAGGLRGAAGRASVVSPSPSSTAGGAAAATSTCRPFELDAVKATPAGEYTDCPQCGRMLIP